MKKNIQNSLLILSLILFCSANAITMRSKTSSSYTRVRSNSHHGFWHNSYSCFLNPHSGKFLSADLSNASLVKPETYCGEDVTKWMYKDHPHYPGYHVLVNKAYPTRFLDVWHSYAILHHSQTTSGTKINAYGTNTGILFRGHHSGKYLSIQNGQVTTSSSSGPSEEFLQIQTL